MRDRTETDHPEYRAHLAGIIAEPEDDLRRLVLADWLEERATSVLDCDGVDGKHSHGGKAGSVIHGEYHEGDPRKAHHHHDHKCPRRSNGFAERAEFIRVQVELAHIGEDPHGDRYWDGQLDDGPATYRKRKALKRRERELWDYGPVREWFGVVGQDVNLGLDADYMPASSRPSFIVRRGLVAEVRVPTLAAWLGGECQFCGGQGRSFFHPNWHQTDCTMCHATGRVGGIGRAVCATQPVERVEVADLELIHAADLWWFHYQPDGYRYWPGSCRLLVELVGATGGYQYREAARAALSNTLIHTARSRVYWGHPTHV